MKKKDSIEKRLYKTIHGPGSDIFGIPDEQEIIADYPLQRYYTGIIFPRKEPSLISDNQFEQEFETDEQLSYSLNGQEISDDTSDDETEIGKHSYIKDQQIITDTNNFYPNSIGLTICTDQNTNSLEVNFSGGFYYLPQNTGEIKIRISSDLSEIIQKNENNFPLINLLNFEGGLMSLKRELKGDSGGKKTRSGEYSQYDEYKKNHAYKNPSIKEFCAKFERLIGRAWVRVPFSQSINLPVDRETKGSLTLPKVVIKECSLTYATKIYYYKKLKYVKLTLINDSKQQPAKRFTNKTPELNAKCLFQSRISIHSGSLKPYKSYIPPLNSSNEDQELAFLYRELKHYGIGHNTALKWDKDKNTISTTFFPVVDSYEYSNQDIDDFNDRDIYNLSIFSELNKVEIIKNLSLFCKAYEDWIETNQNELESLTDNEREIGKRLVEKQLYNKTRIWAGIKALEIDAVFRAFQLANTAMLIQIIISSDHVFGCKEKEPDEAIFPPDHNRIDYFRDYNFDILRNRPKYRKFQLAFFLLNLADLIDTSQGAKDAYVDLLWFPTGGGKTEAYLAVVAFYIIWRRIKYDDSQNDGVNVIMRYTLRLLTSQQFERTSRLICALEVLRNEFKSELKSYPITIGLWVGNQVTPGKVDEAAEIINKYNEILNKGKKIENDSELKKFQVSACPWCGTKLTSNKDIGYRANKKLVINCLNPNCCFHTSLPILVVDEDIYRQPPTILFATVDKFAQIAWKADSNRLFGSLDDDKIPPGLIIQDELHLINGPLGTVVALFESIIEYLCSYKTNTKPKIIASTATTRNTTELIKNIYGGREVNLFPPSGMRYSDNYFSRIVSSNGRRRNIGIMPTGKTFVDTQLQVLPTLLFARIEDCAVNDEYWTIVSYHNTLKDLGKIINKVEDEIKTNLQVLQYRFLADHPEFNFNLKNISQRVSELTGRIENTQIKSTLNRLQNTINVKVDEETKAIKILNPFDIVDLVFATNMFSVGIDVSRLNLMVINGVPKNVAEYIQASSRVARKSNGLVITLLDANRSRDKSFFENFLQFNDGMSKYIEPLSVTPFTENAIKKALTSLFIAFLRNTKIDLNSENSALNFKADYAKEFEDYLLNRFEHSAEESKEYLSTRLKKIIESWEKLLNTERLTYSQLLNSAHSKYENTDSLFFTMQSMREVDTESFIIIREPSGVKHE